MTMTTTTTTITSGKRTDAGTDSDGQGDNSQCRPGTWLYTRATLRRRRCRYAVMYYSDRVKRTRHMQISTRISYCALWTTCTFAHEHHFASTLCVCVYFMGIVCVYFMGSTHNSVCKEANSAAATIPNTIALALACGSVPPSHQATKPSSLVYYTLLYYIHTHTHS